MLSRPFVPQRRGWLTPAKPCAEEQTFLGTERASAADDAEYARKVLAKFRGGGVASVGGMLEIWKRDAWVCDTTRVYWAHASAESLSKLYGDGSWGGKLRKIAWAEKLRLGDISTWTRCEFKEVTRRIAECFGVNLSRESHAVDLWIAKC